MAHPVCRQKSLLNLKTSMASFTNFLKIVFSFNCSTVISIICYNELDIVYKFMLNANCTDYSTNIRPFIMAIDALCRYVSTMRSHPFPDDSSSAFPSQTTPIPSLAHAMFHVIRWNGSRIEHNAYTLERTTAPARSKSVISKVRIK